MLITKEQFQSLKISKTSSCENIFHNISIKNISEFGEKYKEIAELQSRYAENVSCKECEQNFKEKGHVCDFHYHDYVNLCRETKCFRCYTIRSFIIAFNLSDEEKCNKFPQV